MSMSNFEVALTKNICPACATQTDGDLIMNTLLTPRSANAVKNMHGKVTGWKFCEECQKAKDAGAVFLVEVDPEKSIVKDGKIDLKDAWRTGRIWGITHDAFCRIFDVESVPEDVVFIDNQVAEEIGLAVPDQPPSQSSAT